ncbi:MAG: hypothetical protein RJQ00_11205 [Vicingaceae bacterium]
MSDQINEFDQLFRDRLADQTATPPSAVWENIKSTRSYGHVVANRISNNWKIFGTLLMLLLAGGSSIVLLGEQKEIANEAQINTINQITDVVTPIIEKEKKNKIKPTSNLEPSFVAPQIIGLKNEDILDNTNENVPDWQLIASLEQAAFVRPELEDKRLSAYIQGLEGWESAKPKSFVRYYNMEALPKKSVQKRIIEKQPVKAEIDYDYVMPTVDRKTFEERTSILLSFTPQTISKIMQAEYNLSSSYLEERQKTEKTRMAYTFGAMLHYEVKNNKFIETGVQFTQIYEEMSYEGEKRFSNQYDFLEIPILLGYEGRNAKIGWEIKGGFGVQVYNNYKGFILKRLDEFGAPNPNANAQFRLNKGEAVKNIIENNHRLSKNQARHEVLDLENEAENPYKSAGVINFHLAAGLTYYHSINTTFVLTPYYRRTLNSITKEDARFRENIRYVGISFGTRVKF